MWSLSLGINCLFWRVGTSDHLRGQPCDLQEVVGRGVPQGNGFHFFEASNEKSLQASVAHVGVRTFASKALSIECEAFLPAHPLAPGENTRAFAALALRRNTFA